MGTELAIPEVANITRAKAAKLLKTLTMDDLVLLSYGEDRFGRTCDAPAWLAEMAYDESDIRMFGRVG